MAKNAQNSVALSRLERPKNISAASGSAFFTPSLSGGYKHNIYS
jgi:hypothetical protein